MSRVPWMLAGLLLGFAFGGLSTPVALATDRTWSGLGPNPGWTTPNNWFGNVAPSAGDALIFPPGPAQLTSANNFAAGTAFGSITFGGSGYNVVGNSVELSSGITTTNSAGTNLLQLPVVLGADQSWVVGSGGTLLRTGPTELNGHTLTLDSAGTTTVVGAIANSTGTAGLVKSGAGTAELAVANTYNGLTTVSAGQLTIANGGALGTTGAGEGTTVQAGAGLAVRGDITVAEPLTLNGSGPSGAGALRNLDTTTNFWTGPITLDSASAIGAQVAGGALNISGGSGSGGIGGTGGLTKVGPGELRLFSSNSYTGATTVAAGTLRVFHGNALGATGAGTTVQSGATLDATSNFSYAEPLTLNGAGVAGAGALILGGPFTRWTGPITLETTTTVGVTVSERPTIFGAIGGAGGLTKVGTGELILTGNSANTYTGGTVVNEGILTLEKPDGTMALLGSVTVGDGVGGAGADQLRLRNPNQIADTSAVTVNSSGLFDLQGNAETIGSLAGSGQVDLAANPFVATLTVGANDSPASFSGTITDGSLGGALVKVGSSFLTLSGNNSYTGPTVVQAGTLKITHPNALGLAAGGTTVQSSATLAVAGGIIVAETLTLQALATLVNTDASNNTWVGDVNLVGNSSIRGTQSLTISGAIVGSGGFTKTGSGTLSLAGSTPNTYSGTTTVNEGALQLSKSGSVAISGPGPLVIGNSVGAANSARVTFSAADQIADSVAVTVNSSGQLNCSSICDTIGSLDGNGNVQIQSSLLTTGANNASTTFSGVVSGVNGGLAKNGTGTFTLTGANTYTGGTLVNAGTLLVNGSLAGASGVGVAAGATLGGTGTVARINANAGTVSPGTSPGSLSASGNMSFNTSAVSFAVELNGPTAGTQYDQLVVGGTVALGGAALNVAVGAGFTPDFGTVFTIVNNQGAGPVQGTFAEKPEGTVLTLANRQLRLSYVGGSGNDVTLTVLPPPNLGVGVSTAPAAGQVQATIQARTVTCSPNNQLRSIEFFQLDNARVIVPELGTPQSSPFTITFGQAPFPAPPASYQFAVSRVSPGAATVHLRVTDGCQGPPQPNPWTTFVGLGAGVP